MVKNDMKIKHIVGNLSRRSDEKKENKVTDKEFTFGEITNKDVVKLDVEEFKNKCEKVREKQIKNISTLSKGQKGEKLAEISDVLKQVKDVHKLLRISMVLAIKYQILYGCIKKYQNELKKQYIFSK